jgi:hypothetical protein
LGAKRRDKVWIKEVGVVDSATHIHESVFGGLYKSEEAARKGRKHRFGDTAEVPTTKRNRHFRYYEKGIQRWHSPRSRNRIGSLLLPGRSRNLHEIRKIRTIDKPREERNQKTCFLCTCN